MAVIAFPCHLLQSGRRLEGEFVYRIYLDEARQAVFGILQDEQALVQGRIDRKNVEDDGPLSGGRIIYQAGLYAGGDKAAIFQPHHKEITCAGAEGRIAGVIIGERYDFADALAV